MEGKSPVSPIMRHQAWIFLAPTLLAPVLLGATPAVAQVNSTIPYRSPTFTHHYGWGPTSTINARSPIFQRRYSYYGDAYGYGYYGAYGRGSRFSDYSGGYTAGSHAGYYRSVLSSGRGTSASSSLYGSSAIRTYTSDR